MSTVDRRTFLQSTAAIGAVATAAQVARAEDKVSANDTIVLAVMGVNGRGSALAKGFAALPGVEIKHVCDIDENALRRGIVAATSGGGKEPQATPDFRTALDDADVDALVCAAPNHWHGPATILACAAGKHVYVEKPCSHNPREGELMVEAARKHNRVVQLGTQRRSSPLLAEVVQKLQDRAIGNVLFARSWYSNRRPSIGHASADSSVPESLNYELWQGPAPDRPFVDNLVHYNWHWRWHWGNGELGNNGIHSIDICRWALGVDYPVRVSSGGGKYRWDDDQETPDTHSAQFDFGEQMIEWEGLSWSPRGFEKSSFGMSFHGDEGTLCVLEPEYFIYDMQNKEISKGKGGGGDTAHLQNFLDCIRSGEKPNADIEEGYKSTLLCHLGNIAYRTGRTLSIDPTNGHIQNDESAAAMWSREYRPGWEPKV